MCRMTARLSTPFAGLGCPDKATTIGDLRRNGEDGATYPEILVLFNSILDHEYRRQLKDGIGLSFLNDLPTRNNTAYFAKVARIYELAEEFVTERMRARAAATHSDVRGPESVSEAERAAAVKLPSAPIPVPEAGAGHKTGAGSPRVADKSHDVADIGAAIATAGQVTGSPTQRGKCPAQRGKCPYQPGGGAPTNRSSFFIDACLDHLSDSADQAERDSVVRMARAQVLVRLICLFLS